MLLWFSGAFSCGACYKRGEHTLNWPEDAYYSISYKGKVLWAFNYESALDLLNYIKSTDRQRTKYKWGHFLLYIPTVFKTKKARSVIVKRLSKLLLLSRKSL